MRFSDLGTMQVVLEDQTIPVTGRLAAVLAALVMHVNRRVPVDLLLDAVWGEKTTQRSRSTLESHIWRLRRLLEPDRARGQAARLLLSDSGGYQLVAEQMQVDSVRFEQLGLDALDMITTAQPDRALAVVDEALSLWRGDPFEPLIDRTWASGPIARLIETRAQLQERRITALIQLGHPERAVVELEPLLVERPLHERLWGQRMLALHQLGRTEDALRTYQVARRSFLDEIGLEPGHELVELEQRILRDDADLRVVPRTVRAEPVRPVTVKLPRRRTLFGRDKELVALGELLNTEGLITLVGAAGCGKTLLAAEVARAEVTAFPDGVWFVDLSAAVAATDVAALVAVTLGLVVAEGEEAATLTRFAAERRALIVLDNCEQVLNQVAELLERWTSHAAQVQVLATSREALGMSTEVVFPLAPLSVRDDVSSREAFVGEDESAVALFLASARLGADLAAEELFEVRRICRAVDGLPLAIELAAALTLTYSLEEIADEVESDPGQLATVGRGSARHHQTLTAAVERSYRLLGPEEQLLHRRLAVLPGAFGREVAEAVSAPGTPLASSLARLVHASLLTTSRADGRTRFFQLATIRSHAMHVLRAQADVEAAEELRDSWLMHLVAAQPRVGRPEQRSWLDALRRDLPTVRATLSRHLTSGSGQTGAFLVTHLLPLWYYEDLLEEGVRWAEIATTLATTHDPIGVSVRLALASMLAMRSQADRSRRLASDALAQVSAAETGFRFKGQRQPLTAVEQVQFAELLVAAATAFSVTRDADLMRRLLSFVQRTRLDEVDVDLGLTCAAACAIVEVVEGRSSATLERAESTFLSAAAHGNSVAAWLSASSASAIALARRDSTLGQIWSRRVLEQQSASGARSMMSQVETLGDFLALDGQLTSAVKIFSATHHQARRVGHPWPRNPITTELMSQCQAGLSSSDFNSAWAVGPALERRELVEAPTP